VAQSHRYAVYVRRAWTRDGIAGKMQEVLDPFPPSAIVSVDTKIDFQFFWPFRRNSSVIVV
jgi:hypothetical protein